MDKTTEWMNHLRASGVPMPTSPPQAAGPKPSPRLPDPTPPAPSVHTNATPFSEAPGGCLIVLIVAVGLLCAFGLLPRRVHGQTELPDKPAVQSDSVPIKPHPLPAAEPEESSSTKDIILVVVVGVSLCTFVLHLVFWHRSSAQLRTIHAAQLFLIDQPLLEHCTPHEPTCAPLTKPPDETLFQIPTAAELLTSLEHLGVRAPTGNWTVGCATATGPIRERNEDYVLAFGLRASAGRAYRVLLVADGMGGRPHGAQAAFIVVHAAARAIAMRIRASDDASCALQAVRHAMTAASEALGETAYQYGLGPNDGLRTTLICVVMGSQDHGAFAHIGDGYGIILRGAKEAHRFVELQVDRDRPNVLTASLGPQAMGSPRCGTLKCESGDLILIGTDGLANCIVPESFPNDVLCAAIDVDGDLNAVCANIVNAIADASDEHGAICSDNVSLAVASAGIRPSASSSESSRALCLQE